MMIAMLSLGVAVLLVVLAAVLFVRARARQNEMESILQLRAAGGDDVAAAVTRGPSMNPLLKAVSHFLWRSGSEVQAETVAKILWGLLIAIPLVLLMFGWFVGLFMIGVVLATGFVWLTRQAAQRRMKIVEQMPPFLENVMRVLSAGNTLEESIVVAARESPEPLRPLFMSVGRQVRMGAPVESVLMEMGEIHQIGDIKVMSLAAAINRKYGGSLKNILKSLMQAIRQRDIATRELRALTAETRFSAIVLAVIPIGISMYIAVQNRLYYADMWADDTGRGLLLFSVALQVAGILVIWRMMRGTEGAT